MALGTAMAAGRRKQPLLTNLPDGPLRVVHGHSPQAEAGQFLISGQGPQMCCKQSSKEHENAVRRIAGGTKTGHAGGIGGCTDARVERGRTKRSKASGLALSLHHLAGGIAADFFPALTVL